MKEHTITAKDMEKFFAPRREPVMILGPKSYKAFMDELERIDRLMKRQKK